MSSWGDRSLQERQQKGQDPFGNRARYTAFLVPEASALRLKDWVSGRGMQVSINRVDTCVCAHRHTVRKLRSFLSKQKSQRKKPFVLRRVEQKGTRCLKCLNKMPKMVASFQAFVLFTS